MDDDSPAEPELIRVMALHALAYCERLFYFEEVEEIRRADARVYRGRALHEQLEKAEGERGERVSLDLSSSRLGLVGRVDCLKRRDGRLVPYEHKTGTNHRRIRQYEALRSAETRLELARRLAAAKVHSQRAYLLRATRGGERTRAQQNSINEIGRLLDRIERTDDIEVLRGLEGAAARIYFTRLPDLLRAEVDEGMRPQGRSRRPPRDRFNAVLSFGYALLYRQVLQAILAVGLEPAFGFFHAPRSAAAPLVLDLIELFRVPVWDMPVVGSVNRLQWHLTEDFDSREGGVYLTSSGRRKSIALFESRLLDTWKHPELGYSLSYGRTLELEARLLEKEWSGRPGLFATGRLR